MNEIIIIIDSSGSMNEWGKKDSLVYLLSTIKNYFNKKDLNDSKVRYYIWNSELKELSEFVDLTVFKKHDIKKLQEFVSRDNVKKSSIILLSDGNFKVPKKIKFNKHNLYPISIGCDCNRLTLSSLSPVKKVYDCNSLLQILHRICFGGD